LNWKGSDRVEITGAGDVHYEPGPEWRITARGRESSIEHLRIAGGTISGGSSSLELYISGPSISTFGLNGSGRLILKNVAQKTLAVDLRGSGSVQGNGQVERLELRIFGSGDAELADLVTSDIDIDAFGSGDADVAPSGDAEILLIGSGDVRLHATPRHLSTKSIGSGRVIQADTRLPVQTPADAPESEVQERISI
jgi:hypothetical protein